MYNDSMSVRIIDHSPAVNNLMKQRGSIFLRLMSEEMVKISKPVTPKDTGRLRMDITKSVLGLNGQIKWGKGYAAIQETKQFKNYTTPGTGPRYAEKGVKGGVDKTGVIAKRVGLS